MDFKRFEVLEIQFDSVYDWVRLPFVSEYCNQHLPNIVRSFIELDDVKDAESYRVNSTVKLFLFQSMRQCRRYCPNRVFCL